jgi:hypothetical protein
MKRLRLLLLLVAGSWGCASPWPPPEHLPRRLVILPVNNRTGDPLAVAGEGLLDRYVFHAQTVTVGDILETEADVLLRDKGFDPTPADQKKDQARIPTSLPDAIRLAAQQGLGPVCLYLEIRRWEPEGRVHVKYVTVDVEASLVDARSREVLWQSSHRGPVATPGQVLLEAAYVAAVRKVAAEILALIAPESSVPR